MPTLYSITLTMALFAIALGAQTVSFDAASIRANPSGGEIGTTGILPGGTFQGRNVTLSGLIRRAYGPTWNSPLHPRLVAGGPDWVDRDRFNVEARAPEAIAAEPNVQQMRVQAMLKALLGDRFKLRLHTEMRRIAVYQLQQARRDGRVGPCLVRRKADGQRSPVADIPACKAIPGLTQIPLDGEMASAARTIGFLVGTPTVDRTKLDGYYFASVRVRPDQAPTIPFSPGAAPSQDGPTVSEAVEEQLGLRLVDAEDEAEVLVIDSAERPCEN